MKNRSYMLNTILAVVVGIALLAIILTHTFLPAVIIPGRTLPNIVLLSLIALVLDHYLAPNARRCYICVAVFSAITFGVLPWAAGYIPSHEVWKSALTGCVVFTAVTWLFTSMCERIASGPSSKAAPLISAIGLYFAAQCLAGFFF